MVTRTRSTSVSVIWRVTGDAFVTCTPTDVSLSTLAKTPGIYVCACVPLRVAIVNPWRPYSASTALKMRHPSPGKYTAPSCAETKKGRWPGWGQQINQNTSQNEAGELKKYKRQRPRALIDRARAGRLRGSDEKCRINFPEDRTGNDKGNKERNNGHGSGRAI